MSNKDLPGDKKRATGSIEPSLDRQHRNRLWHLRELIKINGGPKALALKLGRSDAYMTQVGGPNPTRAVGDKWVKLIETKLDLPPGFLDSDPPAKVDKDDAYIDQIIATVSHASDANKEFILAMAMWVINRTSELPTGTTGIIDDGSAL